MKNKMMISIFTLLIIVGITGNVFASRIVRPNYGHEEPAVASTVPAGSINMGKLGGTMTGEIVSLSTDTASLIVKDQYDGTSINVLTDPQTLTSLRLGQIVTVAVRRDSSLGQLVRPWNGNTQIPAGMSSYYKEAGQLLQTNMGIVKSVNANKNVVVIDNKHCAVITTASVDAQTASSINPGDTVSIKMQAGNPNALLIGIGR